MAIFLSSFVIIVLAVAAMALGVLFGRRPIAGSCGGLNAFEGGEGCSACSNPCAARAARQRADAAKRGTDERARQPWLEHQTRGARAAETDR